MPKLLMVGDVAGVGESTAQLIAGDPTWTVTHCRVPMYAARAPGPVKAFVLPFRAAHLAITTWRACRSHSPDIVHLHWARMAPFVVTGRAPLVVHAHGTDLRPGLGNWITQNLVRRTLGRAAAVVVATPDLTAEVAGSTYVPNVIDVGQLSAEAASTAPQEPLVLIFSRLSDIKGADTIVDAIRQLDVAETRVVAIAGGAEHEAAATDAGVELISHVDRADIPALLQSATVVVGQQRLGVLGLSELEAMAAERPVISAWDADRYADPPPVISPSSAAELASAIQRLLDDPAERLRLGTEGRRWVVRHHGADAVRARLLSVYEAVGVSADDSG